MSNFDVNIVAIDGYSTPDFNNFNNISFSSVNLNDPDAIEKFLDNRTFDLAICTEVAEHLLPSSSEFLIKSLTGCTNNVIFSAAVPDQLEHGHINCRDRLYWYNLFLSHHFNLADNLRNKIRDNNTLAMWYKLNLMDYTSEYIDHKRVISNLIANESFTASLYYKAQNENIKNLNYLNYPIVKQYFLIRAFLKKL